jgi:hypothetical protein
MNSVSLVLQNFAEEFQEYEENVYTPTTDIAMGSPFSIIIA